MADSEITMTVTTEDAIKGIQHKISVEDGSFNAWYIGTTDNITETLFNSHNVDEQNDKWIYFITTPKQAVEIKEYFMEEGVNSNNVLSEIEGYIVYAYKKNISTKP